jgi:glycosyltransferase involved in cell wall biosynthesis
MEIKSFFAITVVITSCNRPDLLEITIKSFLTFNTYPIFQWIISEDSGIPGVNDKLKEKYPNFTWLESNVQRGQIKSIDDAYSHVNTEYVFHLEEDWETYSDGAIEESIKILKEFPTVSAVMCRNHDTRVYHMSDNPPFLNCWGNWGHYSFNPGLRRMSDYKKFFNSSFTTYFSLTDKNGLRGERLLNDWYKENGFKMALTPDPAGHIRHIGEGRHVEQTKTIGLCMIVKNESHIIHEVLTCTLPLIDTYVIVDTGSTDNTIECIKNFYSAHKIHGFVYEREWKNFGVNRSQALELCNGKMDYIFMMDADDLVRFPKNGKQVLLSLLKNEPNCLKFTVAQGTMHYSRVTAFKSNDGWKYQGVLHEYPANDKANNKILDVPEFVIESRRLGNRTIENPGMKMKKDIALLLEGLKEEPDNERYLFYLAQSYRDDGQLDKAVEFYKKRYEVGRWFEEKYFSAYQIAKITKNKEWVWKAHESNPTRVEAFCSYLEHCRINNTFTHETYAMALYASGIKMSENSLFVETDAYDWKIFDELSIVAFYTGHRDISLQYSDKLLREQKYPTIHHERIIRNRGFCVDMGVCEIEDQTYKDKKQYWDSKVLSIANPGSIVWSPKVEKLSLVIVEPRCHSHLKYILWNFASIYGNTDVNLYIFHGTLNKEFVENIIKDWRNVILVNMGVKNLTWQEYSYKLTTYEFWNTIKTEHCLIFQTDALIFKKIPEKYFKYDFVGAPLRTNNARLYLQNGGLSLRNIEVMKNITKEAGPEFPTHNNGEDLYFSCRIKNVPQFVESVEFCVETYFTKDPIGVHKPWPYNSIENLKDLIK